MLVSTAKSKLGFSKEAFTEISNNLKIIDDEEFNSGEHTKVQFSVYMRTNLGNLVLMIDDGKIANVTEAPYFMSSMGLYPTYSYDVGLMCGKLFIDSAFNVKSAEALKRLVTSSTCYPVGAYCTEHKYILVYSIVVSADLLSDPEINLKDGFRFVPIQSLEVDGTFQKRIADTLVIVKSEGKSDE